MSKIIKLNLNNNNKAFLNKNIHEEIFNNSLVAYSISLPNNYISEIFVTSFGFHDEYRKIIITLYKNETDDHPNNVIQRNEIVIKHYNVLNVLLGKQILKNEFGQSIEFSLKI